MLFTLAFIQPLSRLMLQAVGSELNSYIPLVPLAAGYLLYLRRRTLPASYGTSIAGTMVLSVIAAAALAAAVRLHGALSVNDELGLDHPCLSSASSPPVVFCFSARGGWPPRRFRSLLDFHGAAA